MTILYLVSSVKGISYWCPICLDEGNQALQEFLISCNPKQQHSTALESYLIKPIQRILKYPLLLTQLKVGCYPNQRCWFFPWNRKHEGDKKFNLSVVSLQLCVSAFKSFQSKFDIFNGSHFSSVDLFLFFGPFSWMEADVVGRSDWLLIIRVV